MTAQKQTLEQTRAALAFFHVQDLAVRFTEGDTKRKLYGSFACKLPALLRSAGLCQAIHFLKSRNKEMADSLLDHLALQLRRIDPAIPEGAAPAARVAALCQRSRDSALPHYLWLSREALAVATWYARLAKSELGYEPGDEEGQ